MVKGALDELCIIPDIIRPCKKGEGEEGQELVLVESASDYERKTPYVPREIAKDLVQANRLTVYVEEDFAEQLRVSSVVLPQIPRERRITIGGTQMGEQELLVAIDDAIREASNRPRRQQILLNLLLKDSLSSVWTQSVLDALMKFIKLGDTAILVRGQKLPEGVLPRRESEEDSRLIRYMETVNENGIVTVRELDL